MAGVTPIVLDPGRDPWERQPNESLTRHGQFCAYRDMGRTRSLRKVAESLGLNDRYVRDVAAAYHWRERAEAWDRHLDELFTAAWIEERRKAAEADARILGAALGKIAQRLPSLNAAELSAGDLIRLLDVTMRHRRALFGDPADAVGQIDPEQQARITDSQTAVLVEVIRRVAASLLDASVSMVDQQTAEQIRQAWPDLLQRIVPAQINAVIRGE